MGNELGLLTDVTVQQFPCDLFRHLASASSNINVMNNYLALQYVKNNFTGILHLSLHSAGMASLGCYILHTKYFIS